MIATDSDQVTRMSTLASAGFGADGDPVDIVNI